MSDLLAFLNIVITKWIILENMEKTNDLFGCDVLIKQYFSAFLNKCKELLECFNEFKIKINFPVPYSPTVVFYLVSFSEFSNKNRLRLS